MKTFLVNYNIFGVAEVEAKNEEEAREQFVRKSKKEILDLLNDEIDSGSLEIGTIEKL